MYKIIKYIFYLLTSLILTNCNDSKKAKNNIEPQITDATEIDKEEKHYTEQQLESFLDSIGSLSPSILADSISFVSDSIFKNQMQMNKVISQSDFSKLKQVIKDADEPDRMIDIETAKNIFGEIHIDNRFITDGKIWITFYSFDKRKDDFNEYAILLEHPYMDWSCVLYFFKSNKIIAKHNINHRYGLELEHYKDIDGKTIIYYKENFGSGTGIWQFNFYFYKFYNDKLIPILNELENGNLNGWTKRNFWLETFVTKTRPLTLKLVYYQEFYDTSGGDNDFRMINDSTFIQFTWNENSKTLTGNYEESKISKFQILTYYLDSNELLFINTYYTTLKENLKDKSKRHIILNYLNEIKNNYETNKPLMN